MAVGTKPKITWGTSFASTITFGYPLDSAVSWTEPSEGSVIRRLTNGVMDAWIEGHEARLRAEVRWIPSTATTTPVAATGWDDVNGWCDFLEWAREGHIFRFYPNSSTGSYISSQLVGPEDAPSLEDTDGTRKFTMELRSTDGSLYTGY
jgi:hypothetical protein